MSLKARFNFSILKIKNNRVYQELQNNYFLIAVNVVLILLSINEYIYLLFLIIYLFWMRILSKVLFYFMMIINILLITHYYILETRPKFNDSSVNGSIEEIRNFDYANRILIKSKQGKLYIYDYDFRDLRVGMIINVEGEFVSTRPIKIEGEFDYGAYLKHNHIIGVIRANEIITTGSKFTLGVFVQKIYDYVKNNYDKETLQFVLGLILGDDSGFSEDFRESLIMNGTFHLFAISGSHITLFVLLLTSLFRYFKIKDGYIELLICSFLLIYNVVTNFSPSIIRATLMYLFLVINKRLKLMLSSVDIISIIFIALLLINPYYMYNLGFILSFLISYMIVMISPIIKDKSIIKQSLIISALSQIISLPLTININNSINILSPLSNVLAIFLVETVILPLTILIIFFPYLQGIYNFLIIGFMNISVFTSKYFNIELSFPHFKTIFIIIYFGLIILVVSIRNKKTQKFIIIALLCFLLCLNNIGYFQYNGEVNYLDLYNGESIIIRQPHNQATIVIDTGDGKNEALTKFLKYEGIKTIDYLILTHNHIDHNGELTKILNEFVVSNIIISAYDNSISTVDNLIKVKKGDIIECGGILLHVLNPQNDDTDINDNSIVLYGEIGGLYHLFMGDVSSDLEMKFAHLQVDVIKIAHHGSKTSTDTAFIEQLKPRYAIIQTGHIEKFGFPHNEVVTNLKKVNAEIYRTDINGSITFRYRNKIHIFKTMR